MVENMSEKKSPPRKVWSVDCCRENMQDVGVHSSHSSSRYLGEAEKPTSSKTPQSGRGENKSLKRKLFSSSNSEDEDKKATTPKRRRNVLAGAGSPTPGSTPKTPGGLHRLPMPLSERQQMALLLQLTAEKSQQGDTSPRPSSPPPTAKKTPLEKKVNKRNDRGETPIHLAAIRGDCKQTKRLIKAGVDVNVKDYAGWTPLHEACNHGWPDVARQLLRAGANVNVQGYENDTPLHDAAINGHQKLVEMLLRHGANPVQVNTKGKSPLDVATNEDIIQLLRSEMIASSSSSSSIDEVRSPTSPESGSSDKEEPMRRSSHSKHGADGEELGNKTVVRACPNTDGSDRLHHQENTILTDGGLLHESSDMATNKHLSNELTSLPVTVGRSLLKTDSTTHTATSMTNSNIFKRVHISHHMDKSSSSPRLKLKFQHIKTKAKKPSESPKTLLSKTTTDQNYKSYSVTLATGSEYDQPMSPVDSLSSQDSDLYDPHLDFTSYGSSRHSPASLHNTNQVHNNTAFGKTGCRVSGVPNSNAMDSKSPHTMDVGTKDDPPSRMDLAGPPTPDNQHMPTLPQESVPFVPQFEDISDTEVDDMDSVGNTTKTPLSSCSSHSLAQQHIPTSSSCRLSPDSFHIGVRNNVSSTSCEGGAAGQRSPAPSSPPKQTVAPSPCSTVTSTRLPEASRQNESLTSLDSVDGGSEHSCSNVRQADTSVVSPTHECPPSTAPTTTDAGDETGSRRRKGSGSSRIGDSEKSCCEPAKSDDHVSVRSIEHESVRSSQCDSALELPDLENKDCTGSSSHTKSDDDVPQSPKMADREHREILGFVDGRPSSPKVPPLKIIMPPKTTATSVKAAPSSKVEMSKHTLPYVLNPTQEGGGGGAHVNSEEGAAAAATAAEEAQTICQAAPQVSTTSEAQPAAETKPAEEGNKEATVTSSLQDTVPHTTRRGRHKNSEKVKCHPTENEIEKTGKEKEEGKKKEDEPVTTERRLTRAALRSQQQQQQQQQQKEQKHTGGKDDTNSHDQDSTNDKTHKSEPSNDDIAIHPRKRKLRHRTVEQHNSASSHHYNGAPQPPQGPPHNVEKLLNPYMKFLEIKNKMLSRWSHCDVIIPKAPHGYKDYLLVSCCYVLNGNNAASQLAIPMLPPPNCLTEPMKDLFSNHEKQRYQLRLQHVIERERLMLSVEQEILRVHGQAARALANQSVPLSLCAIMCDEAHAKPLEPCKGDEREPKHSRSRYNGRQLISWQQDVTDKFEKIKENMLARHHSEAESLLAVQKMEWGWKMREVGLCDQWTTPTVDDNCVPMVQVKDEFNLLPT